MGDVLRQVKVVRYVTPLREGGSLPAIAEADDGFLYVLKFRGAGQGARALIAELIGGEIARLLGLKVPELVFADLDESFGRTEPDEEIQDLLKASTGLNLGLHYLSGAISYDPAVARVDPLLASKIVWLDALLMNMDRTARNTNMLWWKNELWLIDHGASLYFHHNWSKREGQSKQPFALIRDHVLLPQASSLLQVHESNLRLLTDEAVWEICRQIPEAWITPNFDEPAEEVRAAYAGFLTERIHHANLFLNEAIHARNALV